MATETKTLADLATVKVAEPQAAPVRTQKLDKLGRAYATGKRKNAIARVWLKPGKGMITVNDKDFKAYFARPVLQMLLQQPLNLANRATQYDIRISVAGGGLSGQAGAVRHGISQSAHLLRTGSAQCSEEAGLPDARQPCRRAQEVRPRQGAQVVPVLEALSHEDFAGLESARPHRRADLFSVTARVAAAARQCHIPPGLPYSVLRHCTRGISEKQMDWLLNGISDLLSVLMTDLHHLVSPQWWRTHSVPLFNILMIDLTLAADNAIVVGMAASRVQPNMRAKVIFWGIAGAVVLRILFASITQQLLQVIGLTLAGGILLLFVCWKMYRQIVDSDAHSIDEVERSLASTAPHANPRPSGAPSGPSSLPTCRCRSTTFWPSQVRQGPRHSSSSSA